MGLTPNSTKMKDQVLQELLEMSDSEAPEELGSSNLQLLSQWFNVENLVSCCIPAFLSECV